MWGTILRSPPTGLHALDQDSWSYSSWKEGADSLGSGHWVQVRGKGQGRHGAQSTESHMWRHVQTQPNTCSLTGVHQYVLWAQPRAGRWKCRPSDVPNEAGTDGDSVGKR